MKRIVVIVIAVLGIALSAGRSEASWGYLGYSGYQPWWNIFAKRYKCLTPEEERLQKFWHDYYDALHCFYKSLDHIDWVAYYKNHGYQINCGAGCAQGCCGRINYAPVFVSPSLQWAVPSNCAGGPPVGPCAPGGPACGAPYGPGPSGPMYGPGPGGYPGMAGGPAGYPGFAGGDGPAMGGYPTGMAGGGYPGGGYPGSGSPGGYPGAFASGPSGAGYPGSGSPGSMPSGPSMAGPPSGPPSPIGSAPVSTPIPGSN